MIDVLRSTAKVRDLSDLELKNVVKRIQLGGAAIFHQQSLTAEDYIGFLKRIGSCETPHQYMNPMEHPEISIVSGAKDERGAKIGMFGAGELGWHSNGNSRHRVREILIALYCVVGDPNSTLSVCQTSLPFLALSEEEKAYYSRIKIKLQYQRDTMYALEEDDPEHLFLVKHRGSIRPLVESHPFTGQPYFYFPYHFIVKAWEGAKVIDHVELIERLKPLIFQSQFQHHFVMQPGDLVLMDQLVTLHRRTPVDKERLLWRVASDYSRLFSSPLDEVSDSRERSTEHEGS